MEATEVEASVSPKKEKPASLSRRRSQCLSQEGKARVSFKKEKPVFLLRRISQCLSQEGEASVSPKKEKPVSLLRERSRCLLTSPSGKGHITRALYTRFQYWGSRFPVASASIIYNNGISLPLPRPAHRLWYTSSATTSKTGGVSSLFFSFSQKGGDIVVRCTTKPLCKWSKE